MKSRKTMLGRATFLGVLVCFLVGCNPIDDPYGCEDRDAFRADDLTLPDAVVGVEYLQLVRDDPAGFSTLVDTAKVAGYGLRFDGQFLRGTPTKPASQESFRWVAGEYGTQCEGRTDAFTTQLTIRPAP